MRKREREQEQRDHPRHHAADLVRDLDALQEAVEVGGTDVPRLVTTYAEAAPREICALFGSTDHLEVAVNAGDAAAVLGLGRGTPAKVRLVR